MAEAAVEPRRQIYRFFCHRCNVEFEDVVQDYTCPYCATGFIERLESEQNDDSFVSGMDDEEYSDADMSNIEDTSHLEDSLEDSLDDLTRATAHGQPMFNDLAFLMTGGRLRPEGGRRVESRNLMEQLVWMINGGRGAPGTVTAGAPFVLVGAPGDYVFGGEGLDAVVTQLLGQLENTGPPPLPTQQIQAIPTEKVTAEQVEANMSCSVCWDNFKLDEVVSRLECAHIFHGACITPWLQLHATCPICRRSLLPPSDQPPSGPTPGIMPLDAGGPRINPTAHTLHTPTFSRVVVRRLGPRRRRDFPPGGTPSDSSSGSSASGRGPGLWSYLTSQLASATASASPSASSSPSVGQRTSTPAPASATSAAAASASASASATSSTSTLSSTDRDTYMDIDYD